MRIFKFLYGYFSIGIAFNLSPYYTVICLNALFAINFYAIPKYYFKFKANNSIICSKIRRTYNLQSVSGFYLAMCWHYSSTRTYNYTLSLAEKMSGVPWLSVHFDNVYSSLTVYEGEHTLCKLFSGRHIHRRVQINN